MNFFCGKEQPGNGSQLFWGLHWLFLSAKKNHQDESNVNFETRFKTQKKNKLHLLYSNVSHPENAHWHQYFLISFYILTATFSIDSRCLYCHGNGISF